MDIHVTKSFLPQLAEYNAYLETIWDTSGQLTNQGPLVIQLEEVLESYLKVKNLHFVANGTLALQLAIKALGIDAGEIITTPFSYVATTNSILWEGCKPVFVDIDPTALCIDPAKIEAAITKNTKAILPVHVFGRPCNIEEIDRIAKKHKLKVIYDGAHAFGVDYKGKSLLSYGDITICSHHATKLFHTIEGGCLVVKDDDINRKVELMKRFGHNGDDYQMLGINAKANELQAAMGLCNIKYVDSNIKKRKIIYDLYNQLLSKSKLTLPNEETGYTPNYAYYNVLFDSETQLLNTVKLLNDNSIYPRRYFYPSLNKLPYINDAAKCPISEDISSRSLCLPFYTELDEEVVSTIADIILDVD